ncbi:ATP11 protein-domain-containing protein [Cristinia sonorae]|uniref:ATP11 protein-domain-containing protein n=1 Tax=Cristinia sonorae TaxID=1940300 RepID=A0A8K0UFX9_9AGAR|nr:ATP11 protein-domain-containing protein [Cristinia sonorae]
MYQVFARPLIPSVLRQGTKSSLTRCTFATSSRLWKDHSVGSQKYIDYTEKYLHKLEKMAEKQGITVEELVKRNNEKAERERKEQAERRAQLDKTTHTAARGYASEDIELEEDSTGGESSTRKRKPAPRTPTRKDSSPVKPLSTILNLDRLLSDVHTPEQVTGLWNAYHASRSQGTGRGYLSASIPVAAYEKMISVAQPYKNFILPLSREDAQVPETDNPVNQTPVEFFYMQWDFYGSPPDPTPSENPFAPPTPSPSLPPTSTILFTPLAEYQRHGTFATPHLVITHYTDLASSHGLVLLRGEITPIGGQLGGAAGASYHLSQHHAQALAVGVQRFYLWNDRSNQPENLLKTFHEKPEEFKWEELLRLSDPTS